MENENTKKLNIFTIFSNKIVKTFLKKNVHPDKNKKVIINNYSIREIDTSFFENVIDKYCHNNLIPYSKNIKSINNISVKKDASNYQCFILFNTKDIDNIDNENVLHIFSNQNNYNHIYNKLSDNDLKKILILFLNGKNSIDNEKEFVTKKKLELSKERKNYIK